MQIFNVRKGSDVGALMASVSATQLQTLQRLNPQLDFKRLGPGDLIIVPEGMADTDFPDGSLKTIGAEAMQSFARFADEAMADASRRLKDAAERARGEEAELANALQSPTVARALGQDPALKAQADEALALAKRATKDTADGVKAFDRTRKAAQAELDALEQRLR